MKKGSRIIALCSAVILVFAISIATHSAPARLVGCQNPTTIAEALTILRENRWRNVSVVELEKIWPSRLTLSDCDSVGCKSAESEDRIIVGLCDCCEIFYFDKEESSSQPGQLDNIIIHYSASAAMPSKQEKSSRGLQDSRRPMWQRLVKSLHRILHGTATRKTSLLVSKSI